MYISSRKLKRSGGSWVVSIPKAVLDALKIDPSKGAEFDIYLLEDRGIVTLQHLKKRAKK